MSKGRKLYLVKYRRLRDTFEHENYLSHPHVNFVRGQVNGEIRLFDCPIEAR